MSEEKVKKIRDLASFTSANPISKDDFLIVATSAGDAATQKASIEEVINGYNQSSQGTVNYPDTSKITFGSEPNTQTLQEIVADLVSQASGTSLETDSVTLDKLNNDIVDPSGGIEIGDNGLKLATSTNATRVQLNVNSSTGIAYTQGTSHQGRTGGYIITDKFATWSDAFTWMSHNLASTGVRVDLVIETDSTEQLSGQWFWRTNNVRYGNINIWSKALFDSNPYSTPSSTAISNPTLTINVDQNSSHSSRFIFWLENVVTMRGINFVVNLGAKRK